VLTGKYSKGIPEGSRLSLPGYKQMLSNGLEEKVAKVDKIAEIAKEIGATVAQFSIAWVAANKNVSTVILGATSIAAIVDFRPRVVTKAVRVVSASREKWLFTEHGNDEGCLRRL
jgi:aryl-alcohol dehydrogenase-like predicted oxidoreductase